MLCSPQRNCLVARNYFHFGKNCLDYCSPAADNRHDGLDDLDYFADCYDFPTVEITGNNFCDINTLTLLVIIATCLNYSCNSDKRAFLAQLTRFSADCLQITQLIKSASRSPASFLNGRFTARVNVATAILDCVSQFGISCKSPY